MTSWLLWPATRCGARRLLGAAGQAGAILLPAASLFGCKEALEVWLPPPVALCCCLALCCCRFTDGGPLYSWNLICLETGLLGNEPPAMAATCCAPGAVELVVEADEDDDDDDADIDDADDDELVKVEVLQVAVLFGELVESSDELKELGGEGAVDDANEEGGAEGVEAPEDDSLLVEELVLLMAVKLDSNCSMLLISPKIQTDSSC